MENFIKNKFAAKAGESLPHDNRAPTQTGGWRENSRMKLSI